MPRLVINCPINSLGYGIFSLYFIGSLLNSIQIFNYNIDLVVVPIGDIDLETTKEMEQIFDIAIKNHFIEKSSFIPNDTDYVIYIWHPAQLTDNLYYKCRKREGISFFERNKLTEQEVLGLLKVDSMISVSTWACEIYTSHNIKNSLYEFIDKIIHVRENIVKIFLDLQKNKNNEMVSFFNNFWWPVSKEFPLIFSGGKWEKRKGQNLLLENVTNCTIVASWSNPFTGGLKQPLEYLTNNKWSLISQGQIDDNIGYIWEKNNVRLILLPRLKSYISLLYTMYTCSRHVSLSAAEGLNMHAVEAILLRNRNILTYNTAHKDMIDSQSPFALNCKPISANDGIWFFGEGEWYPPLEEDLKWLNSKIHAKLENSNDKLFLCLLPKLQPSWDIKCII